MKLSHFTHSAYCPPCRCSFNTDWEFYWGVQFETDPFCSTSQLSFLYTQFQCGIRVLLESSGWNWVIPLRLLIVFPVDAVSTSSENCAGWFRLKLSRFAQLVDYLSVHAVSTDNESWTREFRLLLKFLIVVWNKLPLQWRQHGNKWVNFSLKFTAKLSHSRLTLPLQRRQCENKRVSFSLKSTPKSLSGPKLAASTNAEIHRTEFIIILEWNCLYNGDMSEQSEWVSTWSLQ